MKSKPYKKQETSEFPVSPVYKHLHEIASIRRQFVLAAGGFFIFYYFALSFLSSRMPAFETMDLMPKIIIFSCFLLSQLIILWMILTSYEQTTEEFDEEVKRLLLSLNKKIKK
jgi:hypothetical protein